VICWKGYCHLVQTQFINTFNFLSFKKEGSFSGNYYYLKVAIMHWICPVLMFSLQFYAMFDGISHLS